MKVRPRLKGKRVKKGFYFKLVFLLFHRKRRSHNRKPTVRQPHTAQVKLSLHRDMNPGPPEYEALVLTTRLMIIL
jgi:hypothetical protein